MGLFSLTESQKSCKILIEQGIKNLSNGLYKDGINSLLQAEKIDLDFYEKEYKKKELFKIINEIIHFNLHSDVTFQSCKDAYLLIQYFDKKNVKSLPWGKLALNLLYCSLEKKNRFEKINSQIESFFLKEMENNSYFYSIKFDGIDENLIVDENLSSDPVVNN